MFIRFRFFIFAPQSKVLLTVCFDMEQKACCYPNQDNEIEEFYYDLLTAGDRCKEELVGEYLIFIFFLGVMTKDSSRHVHFITDPSQEGAPPYILYGMSS